MFNLVGVFQGAVTKFVCDVNPATQEYWQAPCLLHLLLKMLTEAEGFVRWRVKKDDDLDDVPLLAKSLGCE